MPLHSSSSFNVWEILIQRLALRVPKLSDLRYSPQIIMNPSANVFDCPTCQARYKLVRMECDDVKFDGQIACRNCRAPLQGREGKDILKYFLVGRGRPRGPRHHHP